MSRGPGRGRVVGRVPLAVALADQNTWTFEDNVAHNNRHSGIYVWQNGAPRTIITRFTGYHCDQGIFAGSYQNLVSYRLHALREQ